MKKGGIATITLGLLLISLLTPLNLYDNFKYLDNGVLLLKNLFICVFEITLITLTISIIYNKAKDSAKVWIVFVMSLIYTFTFLSLLPLNIIIGLVFAVGTTLTLADAYISNY